MSNECPVHDNWNFNRACTCTPERQWARKKKLQEALEAIAQPSIQKGRNIV